MLKSKLKFDDLNLQLGQIIQIQPNPAQSKSRFDCVLVGCIPNEAIIITASTSEGLPSFESGEPVAIRIMGENGIAIFPTMVLYVTEMPVFLIYLDFPRAIQFKTVRNAARINVALPIQVKNLDRDDAQSVSGQVMDISVGGACLDLDEDMASKGDSVEILGKFQIGGLERDLFIHAVVRSKKTGEKIGFEYGVEFHENDEEKLLVLFGYIFNEMAFGKLKRIQN